MNRLEHHDVIEVHAPLEAIEVMAQKLRDLRPEMREDIEFTKFGREDVFRIKDGHKVELPRFRSNGDLSFVVHERADDEGINRVCVYIKKEGGMRVDISRRPDAMGKSVEVYPVCELPLEQLYYYDVETDGSVLNNSDLEKLDDEEIELVLNALKLELDVLWDMKNQGPTRLRLGSLAAQFRVAANNVLHVHN